MQAARRIASSVAKQTSFAGQTPFGARGFAEAAKGEPAEPLMKIENLKNFTRYFGDYLQPWALIPLSIGFGLAYLRMDVYYAPHHDDHGKKH